MEAHIAPMQPTQVNKITSLCEIYSGPHDTQYCMENPEQAFVEYASSPTDEAGDKWYTFKPEQKNSSDTYNPSWKSHPNLRTQRPKEPEKTLEDEFNDLHLNMPVLEVLAHASMYNAILDKYIESLELDKNRLLEEIDHVFGLADGTKSYPVGIVKDVEVHIGKLKLLNDFYVIDMKKDPETPLLVGRGFLSTANAVIDCRKSEIVVGEGITRKDFLDCHLPEEWEIARDAEINPFKDVLVFRRMVKFLGAIPINLKSNMWESEDLIQNPIDWNKPPKNGDGAWHAKIRLIDPDGEEFTKTMQSIPNFRKLSERESPRESLTWTTSTTPRMCDIELYLMRRSLEVLRKFHWMILGG
ncbi:MAK10-like protein [Tanacetum coccineum]